MLHKYSDKQKGLKMENNLNIAGYELSKILTFNDLEVLIGRKVAWFGTRFIYDGPQETKKVRDFNGRQYAIVNNPTGRWNNVAERLFIGELSRLVYRGKQSVNDGVKYGYAMVDARAYKYVKNEWLAEDTDYRQATTAITLDDFHARMPYVVTSTR